jgi:predicted RNA methylase
MIDEPVPPWAPTPDDAARVMLEHARLQPDELVVDLGCGDARLLIQAAQEFGARGWGLEIDPRVTQLARDAVKAAGLEDRVDIDEESYFDVDLGDADVVLCYLNQFHMARLKPKLEEELGDDVRVISHHFPVEGWTPSAVDSRVRACRVFVYER